MLVHVTNHTLDGESETVRLEPAALPERAVNLLWNGAEWSFPCGCYLHPTDDNNTHGGGPHIHACAQHRGER